MADGYSLQWCMVVVAAVVGVAAIVKWLCGGCSREVELCRVVQAERSALFAFLADPRNLTRTHPYTQEILVQREAEEEGGITLKDFVWVEKVPFTATSAVRMRCDPATFSLVMDIVPAGGIFTVQLKWRVLPITEAVRSSESTDLGTSTRPERPQHVHCDVPDADSAADTWQSATKGPIQDPAFLGQNDPDLWITSPTVQNVTQFHNQVRVTGPRAIVLLVVAMTLWSVQTTLSDRVQQHFAKLK